MLFVLLWGLVENCCTDGLLLIGLCFTPLASEPTQSLTFLQDFRGRMEYIRKSTLRSSGLSQVAWFAEVRPS